MKKFLVLMSCLSLLPGQWMALARSQKSESMFKWDRWGEWIGCSRECGIGITSRQRTCMRTIGNILIPAASYTHCQGNEKQYKTCFEKECSYNPEEFLESQCLREVHRSNIRVHGKQYIWNLDKDERKQDPCILHCRGQYPDTFNPSHHLSIAIEAVDGTPCGEEGVLAICLEGECQPLDCSKELLTSPGVCQACGSRENQCSQIERVFTANHLSKGFFQVAKIPRGAVNIKIQEVVDSIGDLALKNMKGDYHLNDDISKETPSGQYYFSGSEVDYRRSNLSESVMETIWLPGPINETLVVMIKSNRNLELGVNMSYKYYAPVINDTEVHNESPQQTYVKRPILKEMFTPKTFIPLELFPNDYSEPYNNYKQTFQEEDLEKPTEISNKSLSLNNREKTGLSENAFNKAINASDTDVDENGNFTRSEMENFSIEFEVNRTLKRIFAQQQNADAKPANADVTPNATVAVDKDYHYLTRCVGSECEPRWVGSAWSKCSASCDEGVQYRLVHCWKMFKELGIDSTISEAQCNSTEKPPKTRPCAAAPCGPQWQTSKWSQCSRSCGQGVRSREVTCSRIGRCNNLQKPIGQQGCLLAACPQVPTTGWETAPWEPCSSSFCGIQRRRVWCTSSASTGSVGIVSENSCPQESKPHSERNCGSSTCPPVWVPQPWGPCLSSCHRTRKLVCGGVEGGRSKVYAEERCLARQLKHPTVRQCSEHPACTQRRATYNWLMSHWSQCSVTCGRGQKTRTVKCYYGNAESSGCSESLKPPDVEECTQPADCPTEQTCEADIRKDCEDIARNNYCRIQYLAKKCCITCADHL